MKYLLGAVAVSLATLLLITGCGGSCDGISVRRGEEMICVPRNQSVNYGEGTPFQVTVPDLPVMPTVRGLTDEDMPARPIPPTSDKPKRLNKEEPFSDPFFNRK